jgi:hypothetical protein
MRAAPISMAFLSLLGQRVSRHSPKHYVFRNRSGHFTTIAEAVRSSKLRGRNRSLLRRAFVVKVNAEIVELMVCECDEPEKNHK